MDLNEIIIDLEQRVAEAEKAAELLPALRHQLEVARQMEAYYGTSAMTGSDVERLVTAARSSLAAMTRREAIKAAMAEIGKPIAPADLTRFLREHGRPNEQAKFVSATLTHMKKRGDARSRGRGRWVLVPEANAEPMAGSGTNLPGGMEGGDT